VAEYTLKLDLTAELDDPVYRNSKKLLRVERHIRQMDKEFLEGQEDARPALGDNLLAPRRLGFVQGWGAFRLSYGAVRHRWASHTQRS
jgi:hypothetical protein